MFPSVTSALKKHWILIIILTVFGTIFCSISLVNHYFFRTASIDLGLFSHALYSYSHFKTNYYTLDLTGYDMNFLSDHFSIIMIPLSPFYYIFGSYTALVIQIAFILIGGIGIYQVSILKLNKTIALIITGHFFTLWGIYSALAFDFHTNVIGAMLVPWIFYARVKNRIKLEILLITLIALCKESMIIWLVFIYIGFLFLDDKKSIKEKARFEIPVILALGLFFITVSSYFMPSLSEGISNNQFKERFPHLGTNAVEVIKSIITQPRYIFSLLFENETSQPELFGIKSEFYFMFLLSGGFLFFRKPAFFIMLLPIIAQKMLPIHSNLWGISGQYSIEVVPLLSLCIIYSLPSYSLQPIWNKLSLFALLILSIIANGSSMENRNSTWYNYRNIRFYSQFHYESSLDVQKVKTALKLIPNNVPISVNMDLGPHLIHRDKLYTFPSVRDAEYIACLKKHGSFYPISEKELIQKIAELKETNSFEAIFENEYLIILRKIK